MITGCIAVMTAARPEMSLSDPKNRTVPVGPFRVEDASFEEVVSRALELRLAHPDRPVLVFALHVGGLNSRHDDEFVGSMEAADLVYADGGSVVWLAKLAGASRIGRTPTTDMGWELLRALSAQLGRPVRIALVGGPPGLAERAGVELTRDHHAQLVATAHGYHDDWLPVIAELSGSHPDVTIVGLGAPAEMLWAQRWRDALPPGLILTCGGWFGHIVGDERRAPKLLRRAGVEWIARLAQQPTRLGPRYARGAISTLALTGPALWLRRTAEGRGLR